MNLLISDKPQLLLDFFKGVHSAVTLQLIREKLVLSFLRTSFSVISCSVTALHTFEKVQQAARACH